MHKLRGSSIISLDSKWFFQNLVSLVLSSITKRGRLKVHLAPKWIWLLMACIIKELMRLLSNEHVQKSSKWKRAIKDAIIAKGTVFELNWRFLCDFYFEFEYRKYHTIKRDAKTLFGEAKVPTWDANILWETQITHLHFGSCSFYRGQKFQPPSEVPRSFRWGVLGQLI